MKSTQNFSFQDVFTLEDLRNIVDATKDLVHTTEVRVYGGDGRPGEGRYATISIKLGDN